VKEDDRAKAEVSGRPARSPRAARQKFSSRRLAAATAISSVGIAAAAGLAPATAQAGGGTYLDSCADIALPYYGPHAEVDLLNGGGWMSNFVEADGACHGGTVAGYACVTQSSNSGGGHYKDYRGSGGYLCNNSSAGVIVASAHHWAAGLSVYHAWPTAFLGRKNHDEHVMYARSVNSI
jgi:hypothetical protein